MIVRAFPIAPPPAERPPERLEYESPTGEPTLVFDDRDEWRMGADGWRVSLRARGRDLSREHQALIALGRGRGVRVTNDMAPWKSDGRMVALLTWEPSALLVLYDLESRRSRRLGGAMIATVQWAPDRDLLLAPSAGAGEVYESSGALRATARWRVAPHEAFFTHWHRGGTFWVIGRATAASATVITRYEAATGAPLETAALDPADLLPYDASAYAGIPRGEFSLRTGRGTLGAGSLLDTWHAARVDDDGCTLRLATYRPTSRPERRHGHLVCDAEPRWVQVELA